VVGLSIIAGLAVMLVLSAKPTVRVPSTKVAQQSAITPLEPDAKVPPYPWGLFKTAAEVNKAYYDQVALDIECRYPQSLRKPLGGWFYKDSTQDSRSEGLAMLWSYAGGASEWRGEVDPAHANLIVSRFSDDRHRTVIISFRSSKWEIARDMASNDDPNFFDSAIRVLVELEITHARELADVKFVGVRW
jgi:hypothetical protein